MMNQILLVGRIKEFVKVGTNCEIKINVSRNYKNENGEYEFDLIPVRAYDSISQNIAEYCREEDIIGIKGRIEIENDKIIIIAEKVTFLNSRKEEE